jgi:aminoglycoside phosphotransferase family enzyme
MTKKTIEQLIAQKDFPCNSVSVHLIETHISWVLVCDAFVYKIKKPIRYSFLDFSTLQKRKFYCERELELNRRLTEDVYVDVLPVKYHSSKIFIGKNSGKIIDYALRMHKLPAEKRMDKLLITGNVSTTDIKKLAKKIGRFHQQGKIIYTKEMADMKVLFNDLQTHKNFLQRHLLCNGLIENAIEVSNKFVAHNRALFTGRIQSGFVRDCHGDLHSRNIFLLPEPQPFDCIEFNDDFREIDVLNQIAFLCMDLDAFGRGDLAALFLKEYNHLFLAMHTTQERLLFVYYKAYRANIRAKINILRAKSTAIQKEKKHALDELYKYLLLMNNYIQEISNYDGS